MLRSVAACLVLGQAQGQTEDVVEVQTKWQSFKAAFAKTYKDDAEELMRFGVFQKNIEHIHDENAKGNSYTLAVNQFSDITSAELAAEHMGFKMPSDASQLYGGAAFLGNHTWEGEDLPASVDWTTQGAVTPIKDQGHCGSCWVFSATGAMEAAYQIARKSLVSLAEQQFVDCDHGFLPPTLGCSGGSMSAAFGFAKSNALCTEASYKYQAKNGKCQKSCTVGMPKGTISGYKGLAPVAKIIPASEKNMMSAVAQQPVSVSLEADKDVFHHYSGGVVEGACGEMPDHGVLVVGYGTDPKLGDYWKVKNSWGASWGEKGYVRVKRGGSSRGECAILNSPSYPVISSSSAEVVV